MKQIKHITLFILIFSLLLSLPVFAQPAVAAGTMNAEAKTTLEDLGILELDSEEPFDETAVMTRAQFASLVANLMALDDSMVNASRDLFQDVTVDHLYYNDIYLVTKAGLMNGYDDSNFGPDDPVTYGQAIKILVAALGYDLYAQQRGGYPTGYLVTAQELDLTQGMSGLSVADTLSVGGAIQLVYNTLDVDIMQKVAYGTEDRYVVQEGTTLLSDRLDIYKISGIMDDNNETRLNADSILPADRVSIGGIICYVGNTNVAEYLGYNLDCYAKYDETLDTYTLLHVAPNEKNDVLTIKSDDLVANDDFTYFTIVYADTNGRVKKANLSSETDIIYNGKACLDYTIQTLQPEEGSLTLIDNNSDGQYDVVLVSEYENYIVSNVDQVTSTIYGKYGVNLVLDLEDSSKRIVLLDEGGSSVKLNSIKAGNVLSVRKSMDGNLIKANIVDDVVTGIVNEVTENAGNTELMIEGIAYQVSKNYENITASNVQEIRVGDVVSAYLDVQGKIADMEISDENSLAYGYVTNGRTQSVIDDDTVTFHVLTTSGEIISCQLAKKVIFNGNPVDAGEVFQSAVFKDANGYFVPQLVKYRLNAAGEIKTINTAVPAAESSENDELLRMYTDKESLVLDSKIFGLKYALGTKTIGFMVPEPVNGVTDESECGVSSGTSMYNGFSPVTISIYDLDAAQVIGAAVAMRPAEFGNYTEKLVLVSKWTQTVDEDGEEAYKLYGYSNGAAVEYVMDNIDIYNIGDTEVVKKLTDLKEGDVIKLSKDFSGKFMQGQFMVSLEGDIEPFRKVVIGWETDRYPERSIVSGMAYGYSDPFISVTHDNGASYIPHEIDWEMITYVYDTQAPAGQKISTGAVGDLVPAGGNGQTDGSWVILYKCWSTIKELIIVK